MAKKVYAVKCGRHTGIFDTWDACRVEVEGYRGAVYKGFANAAEAEAWLSGETPKDALSQSAPQVKGVLQNHVSKARSVSQGALFDLEESDDSAEEYIVYTDGSCLRNPDGPGGWAAVIQPAGTDETRELSGGEASTTNNRMEMTAAVMALRALPKGSRVAFYADSQYLQNAFVKRWLAAWKRRGWVTTAGTPVKNRDLWVMLDDEVECREVHFHWVKGHAGDAANERCDALARREAMKFME